MTTEKQPVTELDVRKAAKRYGAWFGGSQALVAAGCVVNALGWLGLHPALVGNGLVLAGIAAGAYWRRTWKAYEASYRARHEQRMKEIGEDHRDAMRYLAELQADVLGIMGADKH